MSSAGNKFISNEEAVPLFESDVFARNPQSRFAIGMLSSEEVMSNRKSPTVQAYLELRANVYINQTRMLNDDVRQADRTESDKDDERSTHFVVVENRVGKSAIFACMRFIEKTDEYNMKLPIEDYFEEAFTDKPAPVNSIEVSRFIVRHDDDAVRNEAKLRLMAIGLIYSMNHSLGPVYAVVEPEFERSLQTLNIPLKRIAEPKLVSEYNDENVAVEVNKNILGLELSKHQVRPIALPLGAFNYWAKIENSHVETSRQYGS